MQNLIVVNASPLLTDDAVRAKVGPLQTQIDRDFMPRWHGRATAVKVGFATMHDIPSLPADCWPIFINKHSNDPGALGWHDDDSSQNIRIYSRVFAGDCIRFGLDWGVTLSHETLELIADPDIKRAYRMPNGRFAALEVSDAVESDDQAYVVAGHKMSNFVFPSYFSTSKTGPYDYGHKLKAPCPALTPGGYMSITDANGNWTQITADHHDGLAGRRAILRGARRQRRVRTAGDLEIV